MLSQYRIEHKSESQGTD